MAKKKKAPRTNAMRLLDAHKVSYEILTFSDEFHSATEVADLLGLDPAWVYKTLVVQRPRGKPILVMLAGNLQVDLGTLATSVGEKKLHMASHRDAEQLTGLQVGGISALALLNKGFEVCIDRAAQDLDEIIVSAGRRGIDLRLAVTDLVRVTGARWVEATLTRSAPPLSVRTTSGEIH